MTTMVNFVIASAIAFVVFAILPLFVLDREDRRDGFKTSFSIWAVSELIVFVAILFA